MDTGDLFICLDIPTNVSLRIINDCGNDEEQRREQHIHYYVTCSPHALMGWSHIAGQLHYEGEETAERAAKDYVQRAPGTCGCGMCICDRPRQNQPYCAGYQSEIQAYLVAQGDK